MIFRSEARIGELAEQGHSVLHHAFNSGSAEQRPPSVLWQVKLHTKRPYCRRAAPASACRKTRVLAMAGNLEYDGHRTRLDGFCEHLEGLLFPQIEIERPITTPFDPASHHGGAAVRQSAGGCLYGKPQRYRLRGLPPRPAGMDQQVRVIAHDLQKDASKCCLTQSTA